MSPVIGETHEDPYRVIDRIHLDRIDVLTVRHGARRRPKHLRKL